jgi:hypothetical protein
VQDPVAVVVDPGVGALALAEPVGRAGRREYAAARAPPTPAAGAPNRTRVWGTSSQAAIPPGALAA